MATAGDREVEYLAEKALEERPECDVVSPIKFNPRYNAPWCDEKGQLHRILGPVWVTNDGYEFSWINHGRCHRLGGWAQAARVNFPQRGMVYHYAVNGIPFEMHEKDAFDSAVIEYCRTHPRCPSTVAHVEQHPDSEAAYEWLKVTGRLRKSTLASN